MPIALQYLIALLCGSFIGSHIIPESIVGVGYMGLSVVCLYYAFMGNSKMLFAFLPYLVYTEIYARTYMHNIVYLYAQYIMLASFVLLLLKQGTVIVIKSRSFIFILVYAIIELVDSLRTNEPDFARVAVINSFLLFAISFWCATNTVTLKLMNTLLNNFKLAGVYLTGIVAVSHFGSHSEYVLNSSSEHTNGLAPVQLSSYLGSASILFFLAIVNEHERKSLVPNLVVFIMSTIFMVLSFSRGGLYFLGATVIMYFIFNWKKAANYSMLLLLIPVGAFMYNYVLETTNGLIAKRYSQEGSSGRDKLVEIGLEIFQSDPVAGIGTGNFSKEIVKRNLYGVESGAHNEFVRAAAEHGILGIIAYWGFYVSLFVELAMRRGVARQYCLYFFVLYCMILVHNGMKTSVQPYLLIFVISVPVIAKTIKSKNEQTHLQQLG